MDKKTEPPLYRQIVFGICGFVIAFLMPVSVSYFAGLDLKILAISTAWVVSVLAGFWVAIELRNEHMIIIPRRAYK